MGKDRLLSLKEGARDLGRNPLKPTEIAMMHAKNGGQGNPPGPLAALRTRRRATAHQLKRNELAPLGIIETVSSWLATNARCHDLKKEGLPLLSSSATGDSHTRELWGASGYPRLRASITGSAVMHRSHQRPGRLAAT
jgi:hypothetical protein